jgi:hypothetical protein
MIRVNRTPNSLPGPSFPRLSTAAVLVTRESTLFFRNSNMDDQFRCCESVSRLTKSKSP